MAPGPRSVSVDVQNVGTRPGDEVVQVYVLPRDRPPFAPRRWLAAFARIALAAGERRTVSLPIPADALTLVDEQGARGPLKGDRPGGGRRAAGGDGRYRDDARGLIGPDVALSGAYRKK